MSDLRSAPAPQLRPADHLRGDPQDPLLIVYADFECPFCAALHMRLADVAVRVVTRHFPVRSKHPRSWAAAAAAEAAGLQGCFWEMYDSLLADQGRLDDPHLWARARQLDLDVSRFESDRRSAEVESRVTADFQGGVRAGVVTTPTVVRGAQMLHGQALADVAEAWRAII